jgi:hypothetical protein
LTELTRSWLKGGRGAVKRRMNKLVLAVAQEEKRKHANIYFLSLLTPF